MHLIPLLVAALHFTHFYNAPCNAPLSLAGGCSALLHRKNAIFLHFKAIRQLDLLKTHSNSKYPV